MVWGTFLRYHPWFELFKAFMAAIPPVEIERATAAWKRQTDS